MAEIVTVTNVCDKHPDLPGFKRDVQGETYTLTIDGATYDVDLCKVCNGSELDPVRVFLDTYGRKVKGASKARRKAKPTRRVAAKSGTATVTQLPTRSKPAELAEGNGEGDGEGRPGPKTDKEKRHQCLWDPRKYTSSTGLMIHLEKDHGLSTSVAKVFGLMCPLCGSNGGPKLGVHLRSRHKGLTVTEAFLKAKAEGDKHGVAGPVFAQVTA